MEQKNWSIVRRFVGYGRYKGDRACQRLNELYQILRDYNNFFLPSMTLKEKIRDGARVRRRYDAAKTPYQRVLESPTVSQAAKKRLRKRYKDLNPAALHRRIRRLQKKLEKIATRRKRAVEVAAADGPDGQADGQACRLCPQLDHRPLDNPEAQTPPGYPQPLGKLATSFPQPPPPQHQQKPHTCFE